PRDPVATLPQSHSGALVAVDRRCHRVRGAGLRRSGMGEPAVLGRNAPHERRLGIWRRLDVAGLGLRLSSMSAWKKRHLPALALLDLPRAAAYTPLTPRRS